MKNWAKHADHDHTMGELLSRDFPLKRFWEFYHELKRIFHKRDEESIFAETVARVKVDRASSINQRVIWTRCSVDEFWVEDRHELD